MKKRRLHSILVLILIFIGGQGFSQQHLDSIIAANKMKIYENPNVAIEIGKQVYEEATNPKTKINALIHVSNAYLSKRENAKSLEYILKAREYLPMIDGVETKINFLNAIGMQHQQLRIYDKAIAYLDEALTLTESISKNDSINTMLGYNYAIRGFIYREQMSCDIALTYFDKSISAYNKSPENVRNYANLSTLTYNKGNCFLQQMEKNSARTNFEQAIEYANIIDAKSLSGFAKKGLSEVFTGNGNYKKAIAILKEAEKESENVGDLILNLGIYRNLSNNYLALNERELYKMYFKKYQNVQQEIAQKEQKTINNSINNLRNEYQQQTQADLSTLRLFQWILVILSISALIFMVKKIFKSHKMYLKAKQKLETFRS